MSAAVEQETVEGTMSGEDPDTGRMFEVPRVAVVIDEADPNVIRVSFSGQVELERGSPEQVAFYNGLRPGADVDLDISGYVAGPKKTHRRDSDGNVDAVVETKSVVVTDITFQ